MISPIKEWMYGHKENVSVTGSKLYATFGNMRGGIKVFSYTGAPGCQPPLMSLRAQ